MMRIVAAIIGGTLGTGLGVGLGILTGFVYAMLKYSAVYSLTLIYIFEWTLPISAFVGLLIGVRCGTLVYNRVE